MINTLLSSSANDLEKILSLLREQMSGFSISLMKDTSIISVDKGDDHLLDVRVTSELTELYIKEPVMNAPSSLLKDIDLDVRSVATLAISCVRPSRRIHILIELNTPKGRVPIKVTFTSNNFLVSTYDNNVWNKIKPSVLRLAEKIWKICFP